MRPLPSFFRFRVLRSGLVATAMALLLASPGLAQTGPPTEDQLTPEVRAMLEELEETQERLEELQDQALAGSPPLRELQENMADVVSRTLQQIEPEYDRLLERLNQLQREGVAAQQAQDVQKYQEVMTEAQQIQIRIEAAQDETFERPEVSRAVTAYQELLIEEMTKINPVAPLLRNRMEELVAELTRILSDG